MTRARSSSNKAKIARRVIEVLEFFDDDHREATVMDIVRRYDRPQSSTSELLSSLVELGILHKDPLSRSYSLTPRAALLGTAGQPEMLRDGRIVRLMDRLASQTGHTVCLIGLVGLDAQVVAFRKGARDAVCDQQLAGGAKQPLSELAAGWLLLSTREPSRRDGMIRRLNAEADDARKFAYSEMVARVAECGERKYVAGPAGFGTQAQIVCALVPQQPEGHPLAIGILTRPESKLDPDGLVQCIGDAMRHCLPEYDDGNVEQFSTAA